MKFDVRATLKGMLQAAQGEIAQDWPKVKECVRSALEGEERFLSELAQARLDGEIDDDVLSEQLRDEERTLADTLLVCAVMSKKMAQDAANAAIEVFNQAVTTAIQAAAGAALAKKPDKRAKKAAKLPIGSRRLNARPDTVDFRDLMYQPTLIEVGTELALSAYQKVGVPILDQGTEGACTGYGLATVVHYLLRTRDVAPDRVAVSPRMLYAMARRYDEWPGEAYEGSSCRGAMKAWHKHGACSLAHWKHDPRNPDNALDAGRAEDARGRPLGAYLRVNHKDLVAMHASITEVGVLYASASVHSGWEKVKGSGAIPFDDKVRMLGGHAFAIVAYDREGFWIQNSWGRGWGKGGFGRISYADWLTNGDDAWVARLGVPIELPALNGTIGSAFSVSLRARAVAYEDVRPHIVSIGNDGQLKSTGAIATTPSSLQRIVRDDFPRIAAGWAKRRLVIYAHGGLVNEDGAVQRVFDYRNAMLDAQCYPLAFVWHTDYWSVLTDTLRDALARRRPEGAIESAKDFLLDRLDDALEPLARTLSGKAEWDEMKENALRATRSATGGARLFARELQQIADAQLELHLVAHSAGSIFLAPLARLLAAPPPDGLGLAIQSCTLWAPACTTALFAEYYAPLIQSGSIDRFALFTLTNQAEQDDHCARIYNKSLLYLVSNAFEARARIPVLRPEGEPILGMATFVERDAKLKKLLAQGKNAWIQAPNAAAIGQPDASRAFAHGGFDDDDATVRATLARILGSSKKATAAAAAADLSFSSGAGRLADRRTRLNIAAVRR